MADLNVENLTKTYNRAHAVRDVSFHVADGEFVTLLGPSGCGKSTTLSAIAGLTQPTTGRIRAGRTTYFDSDTGVVLPAEKRQLGLVFQSYALWPHMSVRKNLRFPLDLRRVPRGEQARRIERVLDLVEMTHLADRYPHELSGGQQQRVALARTLVYEPSILLLDEPLSNLDAKLRERARVWLSDIRERIRLTTIYVTHDHGEALSLSDRIVVMNGGQVVQIGTPRDIYEVPADQFVADFIGSSNFLHGHICSRRDSNHLAVVQLRNGETVRASVRQDLPVDTPVAMAVRPERIVLMGPGFTPDGREGTVLSGTLNRRSYLGRHWSYEVEVSNEIVRVESPEEYGDPAVQLFVPAAGCQVFKAGEAGGAGTRPAAAPKVAA